MFPEIKKLLGLKEVPFSNERAKVAPFAEKRIKPNAPELIEPLMRAVDAFDTIQNTGKLPPEHLDALIVTVSSSRRPLHENTCGYFGILSRRWPEVCEAIRTMSRDKQAHVRFNAVICLDKSAPSEFVDEILKAALQDKSAKVRQKAADWMERLWNRNILQELEVAFSAETYAATRRTMKHALSVLRDGYLLSSYGDGRFSLRVYSNDGQSTSYWIDQQRIDAEGVEKIVEQFRKESTKL